MYPKPGGRKKPERTDAAGDVEKLWLVLRKRLILPAGAAPACPVSSYVAMLNARKSYHHPECEEELPPPSKLLLLVPGGPLPSLSQ